jgi:ATP-dependent DNA helicase RecQ
MDVTNAAPPPREARPPGTRLSAHLGIAFDLFREGAVVEDVMHKMNLSRSTVADYLTEYVRAEKPASISVWVEDAVYQRVTAAARRVGTDRLKPIFLALSETVSYDAIRLVLAHVQAGTEKPAGP